MTVQKLAEKLRQMNYPSLADYLLSGNKYSLEWLLEMSRLVEAASKAKGETE